MTKKQILQKVAGILVNRLTPKIGTPGNAPGLINKISRPTNINFNSKKISTNVAGGALKTGKVITNG